MMTQSELKERLFYCKDSGEFRWLISHGGIRQSKVAGTLNKNTGYILISFKNKSYLSHRLAWLYVTGEWPKNQIDHINGIRDDNRFCNLREATNQQNLFNLSISSKNKSGFKGVDFHKSTKKWRAQIRINGKKVTLGIYDSPELASDVYKNKAKEIHGNFYKD
jgi:hypothetical protein